MDNFTEAAWVPFTTTVLTGHKILVLAPHPDDESLACGGAIRLHALAQDAVKVLFLTDGALADVQGEYDHAAYVALRESEALVACATLGVSDLEFWRYPDRELSTASGFNERLAATLHSYQPTLIYAPSPLEFHPDHRATAILLWQVIQDTNWQGCVAFFEYNRPLSVNTLVDIGSVIETKQRACLSYQSQLRNHPYWDCTQGLNRYRALTVSTGCTYAEGFFVLESREIVHRALESFALQQCLPAFRAPQTETPLVSLIIRTKDRPALLREALTSVLYQTYRKLEVIVVNDGGLSPDNILAEFNGGLYVRHFAHIQTCGRAAAANTGLKQAAGKYICFLDDDDWIYPHHVKHLVGFLEHTGEQFAYSDCERVDYQWNGERFVASSSQQPFMGLDYNPERLRQGNFIPTVTAMFTRQLLDKTGGCDETLVWLEDWDLWLRMSEHATFHHLPSVSAQYRIFASHDHLHAPWLEIVRQKHGLPTPAVVQHQSYYSQEPEQLRSHAQQLNEQLERLNKKLLLGQAQIQMLENSQSLKWGRKLVQFVPFFLRRWLRTL